MVQIFTLRERLAALPGAVRRRAEAVGARASAVADARAVVPEIPRDAEAGHLERAARRLLRRAAQDEFAREGVTRVPLPEATGRADLRRADVPGDASFRAFVEDVLGAVDIRPSLLERDDAVALRDAPGSADAYGISPEVASDLASYLLGRAFALHREAGTGPSAASAVHGGEGQEEPLEAYLDEQAVLIRTCSSVPLRATSRAAPSRPWPSSRRSMSWDSSSWAAAGKGSGQEAECSATWARPASVRVMSLRPPSACEETSPSSSSWLSVG
jgi:hypothetical protein